MKDGVSSGRDDAITQEVEAATRESPIKYGLSLRTQGDEIKRGYHHQRRLHAAKCVAFANALNKDAKIRKKFYDDLFWRDRVKRLRDEDILRNVFIFVFNAKPKSAAYERACNYAVALGPMFDDDVRPVTLPGIIEREGGLEKMYRGAVKAKRNENDADRTPKIENQEEGATKHLSLDGDSKTGNGGRKSNRLVNGRLAPQYRDAKTLEIELEPSELSRVLKLGEGDSAWLRIRRRPSGGRWERFTSKGIQDRPGT